jgi:hypothetical protein
MQTSAESALTFDFRPLFEREDKANKIQRDTILTPSHG